MVAKIIELADKFESRIRKKLVDGVTKEKPVRFDLTRDIASVPMMVPLLVGIFEAEGFSVEHDYDPFIGDEDALIFRPGTKKYQCDSWWY